MNTQITNYEEKPLGRPIPKIFTESYPSEWVTVVAMVEDHTNYCEECCKKENCTHCSHSNQKCGFPITFKVKPITIPREFEGEYDDNNKDFLQWLWEVYDFPTPEWYCGDKPEDYIITLRTQEQRYDSIIEWLAKKGYYFNPTAHNGVMKPNGAPATFDCLMEEVYQWLLYNRGHTGIDDYIIAIASYRNGASLKFLGSFIGSKKNGLVARIFERAMLQNIPEIITMKEAKQLGLTKTKLLQMGYEEKRVDGKRVMKLS